MSLTIVTSFPEPSIPPLLLTIPTTEAELITLAKAIERFIIVHRAHEGLEKALGKFLVRTRLTPPLAAVRRGIWQAQDRVAHLPRLKRLYEYQKAERPFAHYQQWLRETVKTRATPKSATSNPMTSPASSAPLYTRKTLNRPPRRHLRNRARHRKSVKRKNETDPPPAGSKKPKIDKNVYTRTEPGNCFVPRLITHAIAARPLGGSTNASFPQKPRQRVWPARGANRPASRTNDVRLLGKPAHAKDPVRDKRPVVWKADQASGSKATKQRRTRRRSGAAKHDTEPSTSTADRTDKVSKGTARRDPFVLVPRHSLNLHMGPSQQEAVENLPLDPRIQEATRVQEMMDAEVEELGSRVAQLSVFAERLSQHEALKSAIDDVKVLPPGDIPRHSLKSVIQRCFDLINVQLQRGLDLQNAIGDFSTAVAEGESAFFRASQGLDSL
ncbi:hypothetical protein FA13DRAFT_1718090 [Coprinellus micaceus]|uniref:Uncharacterized protein n=1 Tax=Coprinellus micaceus TaxID=71717 RepID=A0A4Y7SEB3_COPMI|nr:hypothetical protein FA13DRAFT_1718090 [Coprinellus micaceus]